MDAMLPDPAAARPENAVSANSSTVKVDSIGASCGPILPMSRERDGHDGSRHPSPAQVRALHPFRDLPAATLSRMCAAAELRRYADGETVAAAAQWDGSEFLGVLEGAVSSARLDAASGAMVFRQYAVGEVYALAQAVAGVSPDTEDNTTLTADGPVLLLVGDAETLCALVDMDTGLARALMRFFAAELAEAGGAPLALEMSAERRVYEVLMEYVEKDPVQGDWRIARMPKHREVAARARVDESAAAAAVARLIENGVVRREYPGLVINRIEELRKLAG